MRPIELEHSINLKTKGSFSDFKLGLAPEGSKALNFLDDELVYVFIEADATFFHFFNNIMIPALKVINSFDNKELHFVLDSRSLKQSVDNYDVLLTELLHEKQINYTTLNSEDYEYVNAKNFIPINSTYMQGVPLLYNYLIDKYSIGPLPANKKIYISRKNQKTSERRINNEEDLETFFKEIGFEIVYPEDIPSFKEQFKLFNSCSILAGLTGSGLTNLLFMQNKKIVIEIVTELEIRGRHDRVENQIHNFYKDLSMHKDHTLINIFNIEKSSEGIKAKIAETINSLKSMTE
jgi:capsular polysaccharide biosynthesis protein